MIQYERRKSILDYLKKEHTATIRDLSAHVYASEASVRRDVGALEKEGLVTRTWGGVMLANHPNQVIPLRMRDTTEVSNKEAVAKMAAELIFDGATVILDASSTTRRILHYIGDRHDVRIITNNCQLFDPEDNHGFTVYGTGGLYSKKNHSFTGPAAEQYIRTIHADLFFFSSQGISEDGEITDSSEEETSLRRVMLTRADKKIFLCDSSKLGQKRLFTVCHKDDIDRILCDKPLPWE
ncbi:MAG: DeoR/GlpR transcriptional regulator [Ruminococcaceae bacterium]|nr:DeoR/GlpR transcriptional regulator [Oscillospiraceae bacterium]